MSWMSWFSRGGLQNGRAQFAVIARQSGRERLTPLDFGGKRQRRLDVSLSGVAAHTHAPRQIFASGLIRLLHRLRIAVHGGFYVAVHELLWTETGALWRRISRLELLCRFQIAHHIYFEAFVQAFVLVLLLVAAHCYIYGLDLVHVQYGFWRGIEWFRTLVIRWAWWGCLNLTHFLFKSTQSAQNKFVLKWESHVVLFSMLENWLH